MPKLMLIDGNSLVNRAYYGVRPLSAPDGTPTNAIFGFLNILQRLLDDEKPDALCVMFDRREPTFRHKHSEAYKATRKPHAGRSRRADAGFEGRARRARHRAARALRLGGGRSSRHREPHRSGAGLGVRRRHRR